MRNAGSIYAIFRPAGSRISRHGNTLPGYIGYTRMRIPTRKRLRACHRTLLVTRALNMHFFRCAFVLASVCWLAPNVQPCQSAWAQIRGRITDAIDQEPLIGAQIVLPALNIGAVADVEGNYEITRVPDGMHELQVRYIGYRTVTRTITVLPSQALVLHVELYPSAVTLDEVVVTGAGGPVEKRKLGNSIATLHAAALENAPIQTLSDFLQGREPGLVGLPSGGQTGEGARLRIRGSASLSQSNEPIVYVDGVRINNGGGLTFNAGGSPSRLDDINPESIERVEILKGAAAATLYGSEASNGVIQIFTKRGIVGPPQFVFQSEHTAITYPSVFEPNAGFARTQAQADTMARWLGRPGLRAYQLVSAPFMEELYETGYAQTYAASASGGAPGMTYYAGLRWQDEDGPIGGRDRRYPAGKRTLAQDLLRRLQANASLNIFPSDKLQFRVTTNYTDSRLQTVPSNNSIFGVSSMAQSARPEWVAYNNDSGSSGFATINETLQQVIKQRVHRFIATFGTNYRPLRALMLDATAGVDFTARKDTDVRAFGWNIDGFAGSTPDGRRLYRNTGRTELTYAAKATVQHSIAGFLESTLVAGSQGFASREDVLQGAGVGFPGPGFNVAGAASQEDVFEAFSEIVNVGVFVQEQLGYRDLAFLTVGGRLDANSAFGSAFNSVFYPKLSISIIPSAAGSWMEGPLLSSLRIRAAIGQSGLQPGAFDALTTYGSLSSATGAGVAPANLGNPGLSPEISTEWELGAEAGFVQDRIALDATYWDRRVRDALVARQFPVSGGFRAAQLDNIGEIRARGLELSARALVYQSPAASVRLFANAAYLWEQVTDMGGAPPIKVGGSYPRYRNYLVTGYAPGSNFGARLLDVPEGFLPVDLDRDRTPDRESELLLMLPGLRHSYAQLPNTTAQVLLAPNRHPPMGLSGALSHFLGKPAPDWSGSFGGSVTLLRDFSVQTLFEYRAGNFFVNNLTGAFRQSNPSIGRNTPSSAQVELDYITGGTDEDGTPLNDGQVRLDALKRWLGEELALSPFSGLNAIKPADFVRWREISLTYSLPRGMAERLRIRNASVTIAGRNLILWTRYDGVDPELNAVGRGAGTLLDQNFLDGVEAFGLPVSRRFQVATRIGF